MSLQMTLIFGLLTLQMAILAVLLLPLPHVVRVRIVGGWRFVRRQNHYYVGLIFTSLMMVLQFFDCLQKLQRYVKLGQNERGGLLSEHLALKFYAQRNLYISGAVLYFGMSVHTVLTILEKLVVKEESYRSGMKEGELKEIAELKEQIRKRDADIVAMKQQLKGVQSAYDSLNESEPRSKDD